MNELTNNRCSKEPFGWTRWHDELAQRTASSGLLNCLHLRLNWNDGCFDCNVPRLNTTSHCKVELLGSRAKTWITVDVQDCKYLSVCVVVSCCGASSFILGALFKDGDRRSSLSKCLFFRRLNWQSWYELTLQLSIWQRAAMGTPAEAKQKPWLIGAQQLFEVTDKSF